jgi:membrane-associated phospholipid phosphatase
VKRSRVGRHTGQALAAFALFVPAFASSHGARADGLVPPSPPAHTRSDARWTHSNAWDYSLAAGSATALTVEVIVLQPIRPPLRWTGPILFDAAVRSAVRTTNESAQTTLEDVSWTLWGLQVAYPLLVDVPFAWAHGDYELARALFWQDAFTLTFAGAVDFALRQLVGRARPLVYDCLSRGGTNCLDSNESTRSFPGGHVVNSTAASVLTCTQHLYMDLYGGPWDGVTCAATLASDLAIAVMRTVSDNHWATDQLAGIAIGGLIGWGLPYVMHLRNGRAPVHAKGDTRTIESHAPTAIVLPTPMYFDRGAGLGATGVF